MPHGRFIYACEPAATIIRRCGGCHAIAKKLGVSPEAVSKWNRPRENNGTGGAIPPKHWRKVLDMAERKGMARLKTARALRAVAKSKAGDMANAAKRKGDEFERQVAGDITEAGMRAHRVPLSGAVPGYAGDVKVDESPTGIWILQCKITTTRKSALGRPANTSGRGAVVQFLNQVDFGIVSSPEGNFVAMRRNIFLDMLRGKQPAAVNTPRISMKSAKQIAADISGHDALVFRRSSTREWMALVREAGK